MVLLGLELSKVGAFMYMSSVDVVTQSCETLNSR